MNELSPDQISLLTDAELAAALATKLMRWRQVGGYWYCDGVKVAMALEWDPANDAIDSAICLNKIIATAWVLEMYVDAAGAMVKLRRFEPKTEADVCNAKARSIERALAEACLRAAMREENGA